MECRIIYDAFNFWKTVTEIKMEDCRGKQIFLLKIPIKELVRKRVKISGKISNTWDKSPIWDFRIGSSRPWRKTISVCEVHRIMKTSLPFGLRHRAVYLLGYNMTSQPTELQLEFCNPSDVHVRTMLRSDSCTTYHKLLVFVPFFCNVDSILVSR